MKLFFNEKYIVEHSTMETVRKARWIAQSLDTCPLPGVTIESPRSATFDEVKLVHSEHYTRALETGYPENLARSGIGAWGSQIIESVLASTGGVLDAATTALREGVAGTLSSGLHHAHRDYGAGFCTVNGLAIAALQNNISRNILILDVDAHCGGGTHEIVSKYRNITHVDVAVCDYDDYHPAIGNSLFVASSPAAYFDAIKRALVSMDMRDMQFDLCIYNAGVDPATTPMFNTRTMRHVIMMRERLVANWCRLRGLPVVFTIAGGYLVGVTQDELVDLHRATIAAFSDNLAIEYDSTDLAIANRSTVFTFERPAGVIGPIERQHVSLKHRQRLEDREPMRGGAM